jgi:NAD(P)-dependent dehydrogenase (short-subunit alcohol dehydrogenase family)
MTPGERVLITGGSGGIGGAIAIACADRGGWPLVGYCSGESRAAEVVQRCGRGETCPVDLRTPMDLAPPVEAVVHCAAAFAPESSLLDAGDELVAELLEINALGPLRLTRAAAASQCLKRVVFVLSSASFCRGTGPYAFSKAAELDLCRLLANELAPRGVRVDAIALGWTETAMAARAADATGRRLDDVARQHPHGVLLDPVEIGELCAALLFDHADGAPGQLIVWDLRDGSEPVWRALDGAAVEAEFASNDHCILDAQPRKPLAGRN